MLSKTSRVIQSEVKNLTECSGEKGLLGETKVSFVATDAPFASAGRRKECVGRGCQYTEGVRKTRQEPSAVPRSM